MAITDLWRATVVLPYVTAIPEDVATNTFFFGVDPVASPPLTIAATITTRLANFYRNGTYPISNFLSDRIQAGTNACQVKIYDENLPKPSPPIWTGTFTRGTAASADNTPEEVAMCVSFKAAAIPGYPPARLRGRVYIGPFTGGAVTASTGLPHANLITSLKDAGAALLAAQSAECKWMVYSRVASQMHEVTAGWVDNGWDTQRRRGLAPTARTTF